jgi:hypothetical protein
LNARFRPSKIAVNLRQNLICPTIVCTQMTDDPTSTEAADRSVRITSGGNRRYIIDRLRRTGFTELADQVVAQEVSAQHAATLAGFGDRRVRVRKGQRVVDEAEWQRLQQRAHIAQDGWPEKAGRLANSTVPQPDKSASTRIDVKALIG